MGKGGVDLTPSEERSAPAPPEESGLSAADNPELLSKKIAGVAQQDDPSSSGGLNTVADQAPVENTNGPTETLSATPNLLPRETGHDIGMGSPVPLSAELVGIITRLRNMKVQFIQYVRRPLTHPSFFCHAGRRRRLGPLARRRLPCQGRLIALRCQCASDSAEQEEEGRAGADVCSSGREYSGGEPQGRQRCQC